MPIQEKLTPPGLRFSDFAGWALFVYLLLHQTKINGLFLFCFFVEDCSQYLLSRECLGADLLSGCVWNKQTRKCVKLERNIPSSSIEKPACPGKLTLFVEIQEVKAGLHLFVR